MSEALMSGASGRYNTVPISVFTQQVLGHAQNNLAPANLLGAAPPFRVLVISCTNDTRAAPIHRNPFSCDGSVAQQSGLERYAATLLCKKR